MAGGRVLDGADSTASQALIDELLEIRLQPAVFARLEAAALASEAQGGAPSLVRMRIGRAQREIQRSRTQLSVKGR